jgi:DNA-binding NarL/FixJ family response regulator
VEGPTSVDGCPDGSIRVAIIEPDPVEREYLLALISGAPEITLTGGYSDLENALPELQRDQPEMVIADPQDAARDTGEWLRHLHRGAPQASVLILSTEKDRSELFQALEAGVSGWLQKPCEPDQILRAIVVLRNGGAVLSESAARKILQYFKARGSSIGGLSRREREILGLLGQGVQAAQISQRLGLSRSTVRTHVRNMLLKLNTSSRAEAVAKYLNPQA